MKSRYWYCPGAMQAEIAATVTLWRSWGIDCQAGTCRIIEVPR